MANTVELTDEEKTHSKDVQLLTSKPFLYVANSEYDMQLKDFKLTANSLKLAACSSEGIKALRQKEKGKR